MSALFILLKVNIRQIDFMSRCYGYFLWTLN